jgi:hypothetical protein
MVHACHVIYAHKKSTPFMTSIFTKFLNAQQRYQAHVQISYNDYLLNRKFLRVTM